MAESSVQEPPYNSGQFPSPIMPKAQLNLPETGKAVALAIYNTCILGSNSYYSIRNGIFAENRIFAQGKQPFQSYLDLLGVDGKASYSNYVFHPRPVAPKFRDILVNDIMAKIESIDCTGLSIGIQQRKEAKKNEAAFRMQHGDFVSEAEKTSGMQFTNPTDFTPENEDELELWSQLNDKEKEELLMSEGIDFILYNNDQQSIKKELAEDLVDTGLCCEVTYFDGRKRIRTKRVRPEYLVYGTTNTLNFRNMPYVGHLERMSILDVRAMYPNFPEAKLYELAYQFRGLYGNPNSLVDYISDFQLTYTRPYDSYLIDVMFFKYKVLKTIDYTKGVDGYGNPIFEFRKSDGTNPKKQPYKKQIPTWYQGAWLVGAQEVLDWREMPDLIRNNEDVEDVSSGYAIYMLNNNGDMLPMSPMQSIRSSIIQMDLAILRMQNVLAKTPPSGIKMDIDAIMELDMGTGIGKVGPMKLREIYQQTGDVYYSGSKISGDQANKNPIEQLLSSYGGMLQEQMGVYNFELNCIRDYLGINEVKDGSGVNPRLGLGVMQGQVAASNMSTAHIYGGYVSVLTDTAKAIAIMLWDALNIPETNDMYIRLLGKENADFIRYNKDLTRSNYLTRISVNMSQEDRQFLEANIDSALQQGKIQLEDALMVRKYADYNIEYAIRYLSFMEKKRAKMLQQQQMQLQQQQQQATAQLAQAQQEQAMEQEKAKGQIEGAKTKANNDHEYMMILQKVINDCLVAQMQYGTPIPPYVENLIANQEQLQLTQQQFHITKMELDLEQHDLEVMTEQTAEAEQQQRQPQQDQVAA